MSQQIERRVVNLSVCPIKLDKRTEDGKEKQVFVGYAAVFYDANDPGTEYQLFPGMRERVMPTAFDRIVREGHDVRGLLNHEPDNLLGRCSSGTMRLGVDKRGLRYEIDYDEDDADHQRVMAKMKRGDLTGSSFSFWPAPNGQKFCPGGGDGADDIRELHDVDVLDVGPVTFPAYSASSSGVRAIGEPSELRSVVEGQSKALAEQAAADVAKAEQTKNESNAEPAHRSVRDRLRMRLAEAEAA